MKKEPEENELTAGQGLPTPICSRFEFVIVFGPPASGKTLNQAALKAHYKCDHVFDDVFDDSRIAKAAGRIMILSTTREVKEPRGLHPGRRGLITDALFVPVSEAAFAIGEKWITPRGFENAVHPSLNYHADSTRKQSSLPERLETSESLRAVLPRQESVRVVRM